MALSLIREASGNVVLSADTFQLRFYQQFGGTPQEFWQAGQPGPLTYPFGGSGCSLNYETGQDPTQATANSFTPNPVARIDEAGDRFYLREVLFDPAGAYGVSGYIPDFWVSIEAADDYDPDFLTGTGWRTHYNPGSWVSRLDDLDCPILFDAASGKGSGIFCVGNEMVHPTLRNYKNGWISFKTHVSINNDTSNTALAGFFLQKTFPESFIPTKDELYIASGLHLIFNSSGGWALTETVTETVLASGQLTTAQFTKLESSGLEVEVRTHPGMTRYLELRFDYSNPNPTERKLVIVEDTKFIPAEKTFFGYFAQATTGHIQFFYRQIFDMNAKIMSYYFAKPGEKIISHQTVIANDLLFYRANMPGIFMAQNLYNPKSCGYIDLNGAYQEYQGIKKLAQIKSLWAGNVVGTLGLLATPKRVEYNMAISPDAHGQVLQSAHNNEFVLALNPFPESWNTAPELVRNCTVITEWSTKRV